MPDPSAAPAPALKRAINLPFLVFYGLGTTLGAGIYVLIGEVVVEAGAYAPAAFLLAGAVAAFTALSFGEFASRHPESAGEAVYVSAGFSSRWLPALVGLIVAFAGVVSSAALARGVTGYLATFIALPDIAAILIVVLLLGAIAIIGIQESMAVLTVMTILEAGALIVLIGLGFTADPVPQQAAVDLAPHGGIALGILGAAALAFYAFIGFEDMVNVAEEVHNPTRTLPLAIIIVLVVTVLIYAGVSIVAANARGLVDFETEGAPLAALFTALSGLPPQFIAGIGLMAVANGILIQIIMASRVLYGLGKRNMVPQIFATISPRTQTPLVATVSVIVVVLTLAIASNVQTLAQLTSTLILTVFTTVNLSLILVKRRQDGVTPAFKVPLIIPVIGFLSSAVFAVYSGADILLG